MGRKCQSGQSTQDGRRKEPPTGLDLGARAGAKSEAKANQIKKAGPTSRADRQRRPTSLRAGPRSAHDVQPSRGGLRLEAGGRKQATQRESERKRATKGGEMGAGYSSEKQLLDQIFNLKFTSKQLRRSANKCVKDEKSEKLKVKKAIEKGNIEGARIYAQNAIRKRTEQLNYLKLASRLDAVVSKLETQSKMNTVNKNMAGIVKSLDRALKANNLEQVSETMDKFEQQFESLDEQSLETALVMPNANLGEGQQHAQQQPAQKEDD